MDNAEAAFLDAIREDPADITARLVYADWLDECGDVRGEWLRAHCELAELPTTDERFGPLAERERALQDGIDKKWLRKVSLMRVERCAVEFAFECPKHWEALKPIGKSKRGEAVRWCNTCGKRVYYCRTPAEANGLGRFGECVALDVTAVREPGDLDEPAYRTMKMGRVLPPSFRRN